IQAVNGILAVQAGHDILAGGSGSEGDISSDHGGAVLTAGNDIVADKGSLVGIVAFGVNLNTFTATAGRNITVQGGALFNSSGGPMNLTTGVGGTFTANGNHASFGVAVDSTGFGPVAGAITISADDMVLRP